MRKGEFLATLVLGIVVGFGLLAIVYIRNQPPTTNIPGEQFASAIVEAVTLESTLPSENLFSQQTTTPTPQISPVKASATIKDIDDVLLLYNPNRTSSFSTNFCLLAKFYGLGCRKLEISKIGSITPEMLLDENGKPYKLIGVDARLLETRYRVLADRDIQVLLTAVESNGVNLFMGKVTSSIWVDSLTLLSKGSITEITQPQDTTKDWLVSERAPEITAELTGLNVISNQTGALDTFTMTIGEPKGIIPLITSNDDKGKPYPIFIRLKTPSNPSAGSIFIDSGENGQSLEKVPLEDVFYSASSFSQITPLMMTIRYTYGSKIWHSNANYANLTIDDAILTEPDQSLNYSALLELMRTHHFHTTVALVPEKWKSADPHVVTLFLTNPEYFSIAQYGNTGDGYEFYLYEVDPTKAAYTALMPTRTLDDQELAITEGMSRMKFLQDNTGLTFDPVMIFPGGISPKKTFELLKSHDYLATVNAQDLPLGETLPALWDYGMYPVVNNYYGFPNFIRRLPDRSQAYEPALFTSYLDLFIEKPALFYTYPSDRNMFASGMDAFDPIADQINQVVTPIEWRSLGYIAQHLYSEKENDDGSLSIKMFSRELILKNDKPSEQVMHISTPESKDVPAIRVIVNGYEFPFRIEENLLKMDLIVPAGNEMRISIEYDAR
jgi:hypothetical protein